MRYFVRSNDGHEDVNLTHPIIVSGVGQAHLVDPAPLLFSVFCSYDSSLSLSSLLCGEAEYYFLSRTMRLCLVFADSLLLPCIG